MHVFFKVNVISGKLCLAQWKHFEKVKITNERQSEQEQNNLDK